MNQSKQDVNSTVHVLPTSEEEDQTSSEVGEVGDNDVRPRTPIPNETGTCEDGNQTHENSSLETTSKENYVHIGKTALIESEKGKTICIPAADEDVRRREVPDIEEESLVVDIHQLEENNLLPRDPKLLRSNALKDEELKTERKQNEGKISATNEGFEKQINNLQAKYDECKGREIKLETENKELKDENKKNNNELKENIKELLRLKDEEIRDLRTEKKEIAEKYKELLRSSTLKDEEFKIKMKQTEENYEELLRLNDEKIKGLRTERKQYKEIFASTILNQENILQAKHDEDLLRLNNLKDEELKIERKQTEEKYEELLRLKDVNIRGLRTDMKQDKEIFASTILDQAKNLQAKHDKGIGKVQELWNQVCVSHSNKKNELKDKIAILEKECKQLKNCGICLNEQKQILPLPCGHIYLCQKCFVKCNPECPICRKKITSYVKGFIS